MVKIDFESDPLYLSAEEEENKLIAQANIPISNDGVITSERVIARMEGDFPVVEPKDVHYIDVAPKSNFIDLRFINSIFGTR